MQIKCGGAHSIDVLCADTIAGRVKKRPLSFVISTLKVKSKKYFG